MLHLFFFLFLILCGGFKHLNDVHGFLRTLNKLLPKNEDRIDYFLDAFQVCRADKTNTATTKTSQVFNLASQISMDKLHCTVRDGFVRTPEQKKAAKADEGVTVRPTDGKTCSPASVIANHARPTSGNHQQNIVYAASIRQVKYDVSRTNVK